MNKLNVPVKLSALILAFLRTALFQQSAHATCIQPQEEGSWRNADGNTNSLTRTQLRFVCQDQILNGQPYPLGPRGTLTFMVNAIPQIVIGVESMAASSPAIATLMTLVLSEFIRQLILISAL